MRVQPRASRTGLAGWQGDILRVRVTAAPTDGQANRAVVELLAEACRVPRSAVQLVRGAASREKVFRVGDLSLASVRERLGAGR